MTNVERPASKRLMVVAIEMGYGHMRAGAALADALDVPLLACDKPPLSDAVDEKCWRRWRWFYEWLTRTSAKRLGAPLRPVVRNMTAIAPLDADVDHTKASWPVRRLARFIRKKDLGRRLVQTLREERQPLLATYFAPAVAADMAGLERIYLVVTDSDIHRIWAPCDAAGTRITFLVPSERARARLCSYGVPAQAIEVTGFPLPDALVGGPQAHALRRNLAARLVRVDPERCFLDAQAEAVNKELGVLPDAERGGPLTVAFAVGGAGTQAGLATRFLPGLREALHSGRLRLALVAGVRREVERAFLRAIKSAGVNAGVEVLCRDTRAEYFEAFNALLTSTDVLWTKPSEMSFFAALGLPILLAPPVGQHEVHNARWLLENGAALELTDLRDAAARLDAWRSDGTLARAAWAGFTNLPYDGLQRILARLDADARQSPE